MGRSTLQAQAERAAIGGGPPLPMPTSLDDLGPILARWPLMLAYQPDSGELWWRYVVETHTFATLVPAQYVATYRGTASNHARNFLRLDGFTVEAAKVVWLLNHGEWPPRRLLRRDGNYLNDRIENLELSRDLNRKGRERIRPRGVSRLHDRWQAYAELPDGRRKHLGVHKTEEAAIAARLAWDAAQVNDLV